ncbi:gliding motility-associated C-terminal domain-containing protein [Chitinophaga sp. 22321]|uniref:Gliding motility-associated C-terminal domain-containing protein n=1 Tax=Chitinophaga hostae TaxID=2831022 RepID=A0ABS5IZ62_9BACT|nr:gliding motility-associated C-terminal domain-containing protein [Chitinophaga hostae]MBS0028185.1 gliding motility-associated C-terminal domain-containing protein [Chitinophaga hostae]
MLKRHKLSLLMVLLLPFITYAQEGMPVFIRPCGTEILQKEWRKNSIFRGREQAANKAILQRHYMAAPGQLAPPLTLVTLPVVIHIVNEDPDAYSDADVAESIKILNDAFSASGTFAGGRSDTKIQFCLARTAPDGGRTTGILRVRSYLSDYDVDMEGDKITVLGAWDRSRYVNIWVVSDIRSEYMQEFSCGNWTRLKMGGYASAGGDVVVAGLGVTVLAHEIGHYLNLAHTFANRDCKNDDCLKDGDMVCDTPPEKTITGGYACTAPPNSCSTDTLSGFTIDVPDLPDNFMDYGYGDGCILGFTPGQAERMHNFIATALTGMKAGIACNDPCKATITAAFKRDIAYPVVGDVVTFTAAAGPRQTRQWLLDDKPVGTGAEFKLTVTEKRNYLVELRIKDNASGCSAVTTDVVQVSCGVVARCYPSKRKIASKEGIEADTIYFTNRSRNATSWKWLMSNDKGMKEQVVSTDQQLTYVFKIPGNYKVRLYATDGHCNDTTNPVAIAVDDPTPDGIVYVPRIDCYEQNKVRVELFFENRGYKTIPKNTPVSFYDNDPRQGKGRLLGPAFLLPDDLPGKCVSYLYNTIVDVGRPNLDTLVVVLNDTGSTSPLRLPNTDVIETNYNNNISFSRGFRFRAALTPADFTLTPLAQLALKPVSLSGGGIDKATWQASPYLNCTDCINATFTALYRRDTVTTVKVRAYTRYACYSDTTATAHIPIADDYTVKLKNVDCSRGDSLHLIFSLCNNFTKGNIPASLPVDFYDRHPDDHSPAQLGKRFLTPITSTGACNDYECYIRGTTTGKVWAIVNKDRLAYPLSTGLNESSYDNNIFSWNYEPPVSSVLPGDTTVFRKAPFHLRYNVANFDPVTIRWESSSAYKLTCTTCASPGIFMLDSSKVGLQLTNKYGCIINAQEYVHIFPPDMSIELLSAHCYDNSHVLVNFRVCMSNGYDTVFQKIPVSFYTGDAGRPTLLSPRYYTPAPSFGDCREFTYILNVSGANKIAAIVNDDNGFVFKETNYTNNQSSLNYDPFTIKATPAVVELSRPASIQLRTTVSGGTVSSYLWAPQSGLSCITCPNPVAATASSMKYVVTATNEYHCTDTSPVYIQTFVNAGVTMPNAFTPNGDGQNDYFYVIGSRDIQKVKNLSVFNRMGNKIFEATNTPANDRSYGWDGTMGGKQVDVGTYVYFTTIEYADGSTQIVKGTILLIR